MDTTQVVNWQTFNTTDVRFRLGKILAEVERRGKPALIISRSRPRAWLYPYKEATNKEDFFNRWQKEVLPKYAKIKASDLISLLRQDRDQR
ncbi:hypothetical protein FJZ40_02615 [Candidatus Shapirobacteria bacterium]|nr:hypothetical protein [Candidatus Shapirobacteria bacterium]